MIVGILRFSRYLLKVRVTKLRATFGWGACLAVVLALLLTWFLNNVARNSLVAISGFEM